MHFLHLININNKGVGVVCEADGWNMERTRINMHGN
jgi:hypothetical protein